MRLQGIQLVSGELLACVRNSPHIQCCSWYQNLFSILSLFISKFPLLCFQFTNMLKRLKPKNKPCTWSSPSNCHHTQLFFIAKHGVKTLYLRIPFSHLLLTTRYNIVKLSFCPQYCWFYFHKSQQCHSISQIQCLFLFSPFLVSWQNWTPVATLYLQLPCLQWKKNQVFLLANRSFCNCLWPVLLQQLYVTLPKI